MRSFIRLAPLALLVAACAIASFAGCAQKSAAPTKQLTERQRDSTLGTEPIPGAFVVTRALKAQDNAAAAAKKLDADVQAASSDDK
jgi:hypothetical protein